jgi:hypothetical protein
MPPVVGEQAQRLVDRFTRRPHDAHMLVCSSDQLFTIFNFSAATRQA